MMLKKSFKINNVLYSEVLINKTIQEFNDFEILFSNQELVISGASEEEINEIFNEFMNYYLYLYNEGV